MTCAAISHDHAKVVRAGLATTNNVTDVTKRRTETSGGAEIARRTGPGGTTAVGKSGSGDIYAGHDGNVYKKSGDGWQKYDNGGWSSAAQPKPTEN